MRNRNWEFNIFKNFAGDKIKPQMSDSLMQTEQVGMPDTLTLHFEMATITVTSVHCFVNLLLRAMISLVGGGGTCAVVGEIRAGSLVFRSTCFVTGSVSIALLFIMWEIRTGMYSYPFSCFTFLMSHCRVLGLYLRVIISSPDLDFFCGRFTWKFQSIAVSCRLAL